MCGRDKPSIVGEGHTGTEKIFPGEREAARGKQFLVQRFRRDLPLTDFLLY